VLVNVAFGGGLPRRSPIARSRSAATPAKAGSQRGWIRTFSGVAAGERPLSGRRSLRQNDQISLRSFHLAQIAFIAFSACFSAFSGVSAPVAALANMVLMIQVLNASSIAALE